MGRLFVVDTENTNDYSFIDNYEINKEDEIVLFISNNMKGIKADGCIALLNTDAKVITEKIETGEKNSLDFQLIAYVTERAIRGSYEEILINSRDHGYRQVIKYIQDKYYENVSIVSRDRIKKEVAISSEEDTAVNNDNLSEQEKVIDKEETLEIKEDNIPGVEKTVKRQTRRRKKSEAKEDGISPEEKVTTIIKEIVPSATEDQINNILKMKSKSLLLRKLHDELLKTFKEDGKKIYGEIKAYMKK